MRDMRLGAPLLQLLLLLLELHHIHILTHQLRVELPRVVLVVLTAVHRHIALKCNLTAISAAVAKLPAVTIVV